MLPESLIFLLAATTVYAQARPSLELNNVTSFNTLRLPQPPSFAIPQQQKLIISVALCSDSTPSPRFFVSNNSNSDSQDDPGPNEGLNVFEIILEQGQGNWTGTFANGGILAVNSNGAIGVPFELGVSDGSALLNYIASKKCPHVAFQMHLYTKSREICHSLATQPQIKSSYSHRRKQSR